MRMGSNLKLKGVPQDPANDVDPRDEESAEVIDLASRTAYAYPAVTQRRSKADGLGMVAGIALVAGLGAVTLWSMSSARLDESASVGSPAVDPAQELVAAPATPADLTVVPAPTDPGYVASPVMADPAPSPIYSAQPMGEPIPQANSLASPTMVFDGSVPVTAVEPGLDAPVAGEAAAAATGRSAGDFASRIGGVGGGPTSATPMTDPSTTVTQGTLIPAVLETAIDTNVPGFVRAVVSQDVRSFDGTKVLVPRSSRLIGQYQSGLQSGQKRAYVIWTRLIRPDGASVNLASPAIGFDGTTGLKGKVQSNFFQRFGSAMLLSVVGGLSTIASGGASVVLGGGQTAASTALQQDGQIGPTVRIRQGEPIRIFTARDLNFSEVTKG